MQTMSSSFYFLLLLFSSFVYVSHATVFGYVPNTSCATIEGCNFYSPIWNVSGYPSTSDDVYITSNVQITIFLNFTNTALNSITISDSVTLFLNNSNLDLVGRDSNAINNVLVNNSTLVSYSIISGNNISAINSTFYLRASSWFENVTLLSSNFHTAYGTFEYASAYYLIATNSSIYGESTFQTYNAFLYNTYTEIDTLIVDCNGIFAFYSTSANNTLNLGTLNTVNENCRDDINTYLFGDNVIAKIGSGKLQNITVGDNVTLNLKPNSILDTMEINTIRQMSFVNPLTIHCFGYPDEGLQISNPVPLFANIFVEYGIITNNFQNLTIHGTVCGNGEVWPESYFYATKFNVSTVGFNVMKNTTILSAEQLITSSFISNYPSNFTIEAKETSVNFPGVLLEDNAYLFFNGNYVQTGGYLNFTLSSTTDPNSAFLLVNGSVTLRNVYFAGFVTAIFVKRHPLVRSLTKKLHIHELHFSNLVEGGNSFRLVEDDGSLYLEPPETFIQKNWPYLAMAGGILLILIIGFVAFRKIRGSKKSQYSQIN